MDACCKFDIDITLRIVTIKAKNNSGYMCGNISFIIFSSEISLLKRPVAHIVEAI